MRYGIGLGLLYACGWIIVAVRDRKNYVQGFDAGFTAGWDRSSASWGSE